MNWKDTYQKWANFSELDVNLSEQLKQMVHSEKELEDAFYKQLSFGTGGMRGILGPGTNRMNVYTVRKAVEGLANYLEGNVAGYQSRGVAVSYDSRYMSKEFAIETAKVLAAHNIKTYIVETLRPTPLLSFAVRHLGAAAGVMITASHNPPEYNGFKVYNEDGGQLPLAQAEAVISKVNAVSNELTVAVENQTQIEKSGLLEWVGEEVDNAYLDKLKTISVRKADGQIKSDLNIVFTPLHGTAYHLVMLGLKQLGFTSVHVVEEQAVPDPEFSTVTSPNPEEHQAFTMAIEKGLKTDADILFGTDPDADRLGVAVKDGKGSYQVLSGNQLGTLMFDYLMRHTPVEKRNNGRLIKTIVTSEMGRAVASHYGVETIDTLTGFKFIGEKIKQFETTDELFLFGYEESYGYLIGDFVRDKDAVQAAMVACEMAQYWKKQGKTLLDALETLYEEHGFFIEQMDSLTLKGKDGAEQIQAIMKDIRANPIKQFGELNVVAVEDYKTSERTVIATSEVEAIELPKENVLKFILEKNSWVCLRPSGTEPKIKSYYGVCSQSKEESQALVKQLTGTMQSRINSSH
ncbi:phospho-sugar mutase [Aquibacillus salsiterrae]|uniref:phosphoglucomutase (alpha-D-glucose-1,6-bisphosphate-dependent) n=1 Tax=Aquibacillus salsiterrae TaxID=2950439 RepID=A0A9X3WGX6_9BACI|nr:phospho-sugar mutase [Aquibacillus salsiterrae]MDC3416821.1 phospho-sugar mutase [Aquibacillus salsiterrae]